MTTDDYTLLILIVVFVMIAMKVAEFIWPNGRKHLMERPVDVHGTLYKNRKRAGRQNLRGVGVRQLICIGEADYYDMHYGRVVGMLSGVHCDEFFIRTQRGRPPLWAIVPKELVRDKHGSNLCIECNGFDPIGNFYVPVYTSDTPRETEERYNELIMRHEAFLVQREKLVELAEQGAHAMKDALNVKGVNSAIRDRQENVRIVEDKGGEKYDERALD